jgi:hypothetical protein
MGNNKVDRGIIEDIPISDSVNIVKGLYFELTGPVNIPGIKKTVNDLELCFDNSNGDELKAFIIKVSGSDIQDNTAAYKRAYRFTNFLTLKTGKFVFHKRPKEIVNGRIGQIAKSTGSDTVTNNLINLDITNSALESLLNDESRLNQQLSHFSNGSKALEGSNFTEAIKEFYQVIEYDTASPSYLSKYKFLRDGLSHSELTNSDTINELSNFGITCIENPSSTLSPKGKYVDIGDPNVQIILEREAKYLRDEVLSYLDKKLNIKTN